MCVLGGRLYTYCTLIIICSFYFSIVAAERVLDSSDSTRRTHTFSKFVNYEELIDFFTAPRSKQANYFVLGTQTQGLMRKNMAC